MTRTQTIRGYDLSEVVSSLQKAIRRGDARIAGYFAIEMFESNFTAYAWRRLLTISAEDCAGIVTTEIAALQAAMATAGKGRGRIFLAKAVILLCQTGKSRDADHLTNLVYDRRAIDEQQLEAALDEARAEQMPVPDFAYDCHTPRGRQAGKTKQQFFLAEFDALKPRLPGLFDHDVAKLKGEK